MPTIRSILASSFSSFSTHQPEVDLEAQTIAPRPLNTPPSLPLLPPQVHATTIRVQPEVEAGTANAVDDFFEVSHPRRNGSRHDSNITAARCSAEGVFEEVAPPPYADASDLPSYTAVVEPPTLAMYLFKFGFLFPFFWLAGIVILISPLSAPGGWEPTKSEAERQELIFLLRKTEKKWAKRCLVAFLVLIVITLVASLTAALVIKA